MKQLLLTFFIIVFSVSFSLSQGDCRKFSAGSQNPQNKNWQVPIEGNDLGFVWTTAETCKSGIIKFEADIYNNTRKKHRVRLKVIIIDVDRNVLFEEYSPYQVVDYYSNSDGYKAKYKHTISVSKANLELAKKGYSGYFRAEEDHTFVDPDSGKVTNCKIDCDINKYIFSSLFDCEWDVYVHYGVLNDCSEFKFAGNFNKAKGFTLKYNYKQNPITHIKIVANNNSVCSQSQWEKIWETTIECDKNKVEPTVWNKTIDKRCE